MMKVPHVDLLVVGLPVALLALKKASLEKSMVGSHQVGGGKAITVHKALAVAQPQGALVHYAAEHEKMATIGNEQSLVIDPGSRTFDWLVCRGMRLVQKQSHSINRGMSDVLRLLAAEISKDIGTPYRDFDAIDLALRTGMIPIIFQKPCAGSTAGLWKRSSDHCGECARTGWAPSAVGADTPFGGTGAGVDRAREAVMARAPTSRTDTTPVSAVSDRLSSARADGRREGVI